MNQNIFQDQHIPQSCSDSQSNTSHIHNHNLQSSSIQENNSISPTSDNHSFSNDHTNIIPYCNDFDSYLLSYSFKSSDKIQIVAQKIFENRIYVYVHISEIKKIVFVKKSYVCSICRRIIKKWNKDIKKKFQTSLKNIKHVDIPENLLSLDVITLEQFSDFRREVNRSFHSSSESPSVKRFGAAIQEESFRKMLINPIFNKEVASIQEIKKHPLILNHELYCNNPKFDSIHLLPTSLKKKSNFQFAHATIGLNLQSKYHLVQEENRKHHQDFEPQNRLIAFIDSFKSQYQDSNTIWIWDNLFSRSQFIQTNSKDILKWSKFFKIHFPQLTFELKEYVLSSSPQAMNFVNSEKNQNNYHPFKALCSTVSRFFVFIICKLRITFNSLLHILTKDNIRHWINFLTLDLKIVNGQTMKLHLLNILKLFSVVTDKEDSLIRTNPVIQLQLKSCKKELLTQEKYYSTWNITIQNSRNSIQNAIKNQRYLEPPQLLFLENILLIQLYRVINLHEEEEDAIVKKVLVFFQQCLITLMILASGGQRQEVIRTIKIPNINIYHCTTKKFTSELERHQFWTNFKFTPDMNNSDLFFQQPIVHFIEIEKCMRKSNSTYDLGKALAFPVYWWIHVGRPIWIKNLTSIVPNTSKKEIKKSSFLFLNTRGSEWDDSFITDSVKINFASILGVSISPRDLRNLISCTVRDELLKDPTLENSLLWENICDIQNHSRNVAKTYYTWVDKSKSDNEHGNLIHQILHQNNTLQHSSSSNDSIHTNPEHTIQIITHYIQNNSLENNILQSIETQLKHIINIIQNKLNQNNSNINHTQHLSTSIHISNLPSDSIISNQIHIREHQTDSLPNSIENQLFTYQHQLSSSIDLSTNENQNNSQSLDHSLFLNQDSISFNSQNLSQNLSNPIESINHQTYIHPIYNLTQHKSSENNQENPLKRKRDQLE